MDEQMDETMDYRMEEWTVNNEMDGPMEGQK